MAESGGNSSSGNSEKNSDSRIKMRNTTRDVHVIDKVENLAEKTRTAYVRTKQDVRSVLEEDYNNEVNYAQDRAGETAGRGAEEAGDKAKKGSRKVKDEARKQIEKRLDKKLDGEKSRYRQDRATEQGRIRARDQAHLRDIKTREASWQESGTIKTTAKSSGRASVKTAGHSVKGTGKTIRTMESTSKAAVKTTQKAAQATKQGAEAAAKTSEKAAIAAKNAASAAGRAIVSAAKAVAAAAKAAASSIGKLAASAAAGIISAAPFLILGGVVLSVAVLCTGDTSHDSTGVNTASVIAGINAKWQEQLGEIKSGFEDVTMEGGRATWPQIFAIYTAQSSETSVDDWDEKNSLSRIFWEMNWISYDIYTVIEAKQVPETDVKVLMRSVDVTFLYFNDGTVYRTETETYRNEKTPEEIYKEYPERTVHSAITITANHKPVEEMMEALGFTPYLKEYVEGLLDPEFTSFWQARIYGVTGADDDIVNVAITQLGNSGGWPYWEYAGFDSRVEWCACFVSWCAGQCGYIKDGLFINTGSPPEQASFFKSNGHWMDGNATPSPGMIIFFDWDNADFADHVAIVEKVEDGLVHTIEGNADDSVMRLTWPLGDSQIMGYGWIVES